jgi:hypothetical protein
VGTVRLKRGRLPGEERDPPEKELVVRYHALRVDWDLRYLAEEACQRSEKGPAHRGGARVRRGRRR